MNMDLDTQVVEPKAPDFLDEIANFIFTSKYARYNPVAQRRETWDECIDRVETMHLKQYRKRLSKSDVKKVKEAFQAVREKRVVPSMRSMQFGGPAIEAANSRLFNCAVRHIDSPRAFSEVFYLLLCGCGVGIGVIPHFINRLPDLVNASDKTGAVLTYTIEDTIEGWADSLEALLNCYFKNTAYTGRKIVFDYSKIRPEGAPIKTGGGKAPGYRGLKNCHIKIKALLDHVIEDLEQTRLKTINTYDILMHAADAVLSGGVRRSATCVIFDPSDQDMIDAKAYVPVTKYSKFSLDDETQTYHGKVTINRKVYEVSIPAKSFEWEYGQLVNEKRISWVHIEPQRARSNNSVLLLRDKTSQAQFKAIVEKTKDFGEPGFVFANHPWQMYNPCFERNTRIATDRGLIRIEDLYKSKASFNTLVDNRIQKKLYYSERYGVSPKEVLQARLTQSNAPLFRVRTEHGHELLVTDNHEFMTTGGRKKLKNLKIKDVILIQSAEGKFGPEGNFEEGFLLGLAAGDGSVDESSVTLQLWGDDLESKPAIELALSRLGGGERTEEEFTPLVGSDLKVYTLRSLKLYAWMQSQGISDPKSIKTAIPECIWQGSKERVKGYIQGLFHASGAVNVEGLKTGMGHTLRLDMGQPTSEFLRGVQILLNNFGVVSRVYKLSEEVFHDDEVTKAGKLQDSRIGYVLGINRVNSTTLWFNVGLGGSKGKQLQALWAVRESGQLGNESFLTEIREITPEHKDDVFCFTERDTNSTIANGLAVGQCFEISFIPVTDDGVCGVQFCNLSSINGAMVQTEEDFFRAVEAATIIGTLQAGYTQTMSYLSVAARQLTESEALLGVSITGIMDNPEVLLDPKVQQLGAAQAVEVNQNWATKIGINSAARITCVKPEGCLVASTLLATSDGIKRLGTFGDPSGPQWQEAPTKVLSEHDYRDTPRFYVNGEVPTIKARMRSGLQLEGTLNHKVKVLRKSKVVWTTFKDLEAGDKVVFRLGGYTGPTELRKLSPLKIGKLTPPSYLTAELAWIIGCIFGSGKLGDSAVMLTNKGCANEHTAAIVESAAAALLTLFKSHASLRITKENEVSTWAWEDMDALEVVEFLRQNGITKPKNRTTTIPDIILSSPVSVLESFLNGYSSIQGYFELGAVTKYHTTSFEMAQQIAVCLRYLGTDCAIDVFSSGGGKTKYWVYERLNTSELTYSSVTYKKDDMAALQGAGFTEHFYDIISTLEDGVSPTYDIEVPTNHTYLANSFISHNTSSLVLKSASGVHPHHAREYFRRVQCNKVDSVYKFFKSQNPHMCEEGVWSANKTDDVISFPLTIPEKAVVKEDLTALQHLEYIKSTQQNWVLPGSQTERNTRPIEHNVSCTVMVDDHEWDSVIEYLYQNREYFAAVSLLPKIGDKLYKQAPLEAITTQEDRDKWQKIVEAYTPVDYRELTEDQDDTKLQDTAACAGGKCEI